MGYKFQFVTLAGFHALNHSMFELARGYADEGMSAYVRLQEAEFAAEADGYTATKHQAEVGTGYFDTITQIIAGGASSTTALTGSTEAEQFTPTPAPPYDGHGPNAACQPILGDCPSIPSPEQVVTNIKPAKPGAEA